MRNKPDALLKTFLKIYDFKKAIDKKIFFGITLEGKGFYFLKEKISERIAPFSWRPRRESSASI